MDVNSLEKQDFDKSLAEEFASKMLQFLNDGMLSLMISIGYKTQLFDTMLRNTIIATETMMTIITIINMEGEDFLATCFIKIPARIR